MEDLQKIKENAWKIELFPELEFTIEKVQQSITARANEIKAELDKVLDKKQHFTMPPRVSFPRANRTVAANIPRNSSQMIFQEFVDQNHIAYITRLALLIPAQNQSAYEMFIDGSMYKTRITWQIGNSNIPEIIDPPIKVNSNVRIVAINNSNHPLCFEIFLDGFMMMNPKTWFAQWGIAPD